MQRQEGRADAARGEHAAPPRTRRTPHESLAEAQALAPQVLQLESIPRQRLLVGRARVRREARGPGAPGFALRPATSPRTGHSRQKSLAPRSVIVYRKFTLTVRHGACPTVVVR